MCHFTLVCLNVCLSVCLTVCMMVFLSVLSIKVQLQSILKILSAEVVVVVVGTEEITY